MTTAVESWQTTLKQPDGVVALHNRHKGQRAFLCGAGPSMRSQVSLLPQLESEIVFTCNRMARWEECPFVPDYHCITEPSALEHLGLHNCDRWEQTEKFGFHWAPIHKGRNVERDGWSWVAKAPDDLQIRNVGFHGLGDTLPPLPSGYVSPLTMAQLAAWMGVTEFIFLGIDTNDAGYVFNVDHRRDVHPLTIKGILESFARAREDIEAAGLKVYDCTPGGLVSAECALEYRPLEDVL